MEIDEKLDFVYDIVDRLLSAGAFEIVDDCLSIMTEEAIKEANPEILLGVLTATLPATSKLKNREAFFNRVDTLLADPKLLEGLNPK